MGSTFTYRKKIAAGLLALMCINLLLPPACLALTSGPSQPETHSFQPAGVSDMVDLFTGGLKYNIPLLDVDGYPINLNYESGSGMDDEASWVGLGWNVNVGAINRQVRGIPDDMAGDDVESDNYTKPKVTIGGRVTGKFELFGKGKLIHATGSGSFGLGIFNDNYTGIGAEVTANAGISFQTANENAFTTSLGIGVNSSTASGVDVSPSLNLGISRSIADKTVTYASLSASLGYNSRSGLKSLTLGSGFSLSENTNKTTLSVSGGASGSFITYNTEPVLPNIQVPYRSRYGSFSIDAGAAFTGAFLSVGATGYKNVRSIASTRLDNPAYGFMYAERGKNQKNAVMDFTREKENTVIPELPNLALPVTTPDLFSYTSQAGSGQFRLYRGGSGAYFDNAVSDDNASTSAGLDLGIGVSPPGIDHGGVTLFNQSTSNNTRKWVSNNNYLTSGDFQDVSYTNPGAQHMYFKVVGEKTAEDAAMVSQVHDTQPLEVSITGKTANAQFTNNTLTKLQKTSRAVNRTVISYLTASEAAQAGLDKAIKNYPVYDASNFQPPVNHTPVPVTTFQRADNGYRRPHHLSEITVTNESGKRLVYGLPVYNVKQTEYSFAIGAKGRDYTILPGTNNQVPVTLTGGQISHAKGIDQYYHAQTQPAYASSFLLTAILSPDYVDRTGDGISDDDPGTAIKFNYSRMPNLFKWRTPFNGATLNRGLLADKDDDKASIVYGEKELWYVSSVESKTKIAYFITQNRRDAMGVADFTGGADMNNAQKCLEEIRLYSKADMSKPIKVVKFEYSYELCRGVPNNADNSGGVMSSDPLKGGKLTLKKVYFEYANSPKGANFPYQFTYQNGVNGQVVNYTDMAADRWGVYKTSSENLFPLPNDAFPYTNQDIQGNDPSVKARLDQNAALWHLSAIQLPTGGTISVTYESDDYAYVQNKRAMAMSAITSLIDGNGNDLDSASLKSAKGIRVKIPNSTVTGDPTAWFKTNYMNGSDYIYTKFFVKVSTPNSNSGGPPYDYDFVPCYAQIRSVSVSGGYASVIFRDRSDGGVTANPVVFSAWQRMKDEYPRYAFPGFDQRAGDGQTSSAVATAVKAVLSSIGNLSELTENFYHKAFRLSYASQMGLSRCFVKLTKQDGHKLGGGVRVRKIQISDSWQSMAGNAGQPAANYGQQYDYTTTDNGKTISSGVAAYEPAVGNDENPLKQPVPYVQKIKGSIDDFFDLEQPFGESFFPAPTVGYSKVTVTDLDKNGNADPALRTGYSVDEFYTARDFPVQVTTMLINSNENKPPVNKFSFLGATSIDELTMSQGYSIVLNDMHGKQKATRTYNQSGSEIASTVYNYNASPLGAGGYTLNNTVSVVNPDGSISPNQVLGRDIDFFTDFREFETKTTGRANDAGFDFVGAFFFSFPVFYLPTYDNSDYKLFRSACAVKVSQYYGIVSNVVRKENGSTITTQDLAYDGQTGEPVVTQTQNEFNNAIYSTHIPAYWVYRGMGPAYQNAGILLQNFTTDASGQFPSYGSYLNGGDQLVDLNDGNIYWVVENQAASAASSTKKLITAIGGIKAGFRPRGLVKLIRSGYRNMLSSTTQSLVSLNNPIQYGHLLYTSGADLTSLKVINASATTFNESWAMNQNGMPPDNTQVGTVVSSAYGNAVQLSSRGSGGVYFFANGSTGGTEGVITNEYLQQGLNRSGIWPTPVTDQRLNQPVDIEKDIYLDANDYYIGYESDNNNSNIFQIDNVSLPVRSTTLWCMYPITLSAGIHHITLKMTNSDSSYPGGIGMEIYTGTRTQLENASPGGFGINTVFTTASLANLNDIQVPVYRQSVNPYVRGFLGNWREYGSNVFQQSRHYNTDPAVAGVNVKNAGYINNFTPYWYYGAGPGGQTAWVTDQSNGRSRWITANTVTAYDRFGQQLENRDALGRYSAALFNFNGELPGAVASNALNREIYAGSFEDSRFTPGTGLAVSVPNEFKQTGSSTDISQFITSAASHSGNYSVLLPAAGLTLSTNSYSQVLGTGSLLSINDYGEYNLISTPGLYPNGFEPSPGKKYIFDVWVKDGHPTDRSVNLALSLNGSTVTLVCKALVEDWKLLEGTIDLTGLPAGAVTLSLTSPVSALYLDDLRIHPADAQMKSYVYDDKTMRLMAEIDENGFATFYEYDDEGLLIRVKKETERGVMTIKESRSSYKKGS
ncbi:MAG TPA: hypothetical protein VNW95_15030 [Mucilaginibacter sp.]|jgi:hypothetical protein|nr:hypothetical protein [Mucilaginibacter sp.]